MSRWLLGARRWASATGRAFERPVRGLLAFCSGWRRRAEVSKLHTTAPEPSMPADALHREQNEGRSWVKVSSSAASLRVLSADGCRCICKAAIELTRRGGAQRGLREGGNWESERGRIADLARILFSNSRFLPREESSRRVEPSRLLTSCHSLALFATTITRLQTASSTPYQATALSSKQR